DVPASPFGFLNSNDDVDPVCSEERFLPRVDPLPIVFSVFFGSTRSTVITWVSENTSSILYELDESE
ncbi:unnamed protein product, partial [Allacma fusca]